jgi:hypothetical protein
MLGTPKADLLEAVMGLRELFPTSGWVRWGNMVDDICTDVNEEWSSPELVDVWDQRVVKDALFARFGLNEFCAWHLNDFSAWRYQVAKSKSRMAAQAALQRRLCEDSVSKICSFLC